MKSLDLINERIEDLESRLESVNYLANDNPSYFGKQLISDLNKHLSSCKTIKQDLEVLEIIRKKKVNLVFIEHRIRLVNLKKMTLENALEGYNFANEPLTMEELIKLKQWLEREKKKND